MPRQENALLTLKGRGDRLIRLSPLISTRAHDCSLRQKDYQVFQPMRRFILPSL